MSPEVRRLVLDVLKPHEPDAIVVATAIADHDGVDGVNVTLLETDREVQNLTLTIEGEAIDAAAIEETVDELGGTVHSIDQVVCGDRTVEQIKTPQDR
jgi:hypothetical protein